MIGPIRFSSSGRSRIMDLQVVDRVEIDYRIGLRRIESDGKCGNCRFVCDNPCIALSFA